MAIAKLFYSLVNTEIKTLIAVLFWGNAVSIVLVFTCRYANRRLKDRRLYTYYGFAKICQAVAYFLLFFRDILPDFASINLGNSLLFVGFYLEALSMMLTLRGKTKTPTILLATILTVALLLFNGMEIASPTSSARIAVSSICVFLILLLPSIEMLRTKRSISAFKHLAGILYLVFSSLQLPRAFYACMVDITILTNSFIQCLTFTSLVMLMVFGLPAYLLMMKEDQDRIVESLASTDTLTELPNRRGFLESAERYFNRHRRLETPLTILFLDIDHFKLVNDTHGHSFGDEVLVALAATIRKTLRVGDLPCRYGGEEFVLLIPDTDVVQASIAALRLMEAVRQISFPQYPAFSFTISIGIMGGVPGPEDTLAGFLEKADQALYCAKANGRNRIEGYSPPVL